MKTLPAAAIAAIILWGVTVPAVRTPASPTGQTDARQSGKTLDDASLQEMLVGLGYEPKKLSKGFLIAIKKDTWTYNMQFVLSPDTTRLGMNANLGLVPDPDAVTAAQWRGLLEESGEVDPSSFNFNKEQKKLYLHRVLDNRAITPSYIRQQVDNFCANIKDSAEFWKFTK